MKLPLFLLSKTLKIPVVLHFPYHRHKAGRASGQQTVLWTFAVSGALWHSSRSLL
jgi:hypothetical protein